MPWSPCSPEPYPSIGALWRARFGQTVRRVGLDPGFPCPHRHPLTGRGCVFCAPPDTPARRSVGEQLAAGMARLRRQGVSRFAAYFQTGTATNAPLADLVAVWGAATAPREVVALCVGTRPDCVSDAVLKRLSGYGHGRDVWLELGLQSAREQTLRALNRGHTGGQFADACRRARDRGLRVCAHVILGLPGEDAGDEAYTAEQLTLWGVTGVKLHQLAVVRGTPLEARWRAGEFAVLGEAEYVARAAAFCRCLPPTTVLHRLVGEIAAAQLVAPHFDKDWVLRTIRRQLGAEGTAAAGNENTGPGAGVS